MVEYNPEELAKIMIKKLDELDFDGQDFTINNEQFVVLSRHQFEKISVVIRDVVKEYLNQEKEIGE